MKIFRIICGCLLLITKEISAGGYGFVIERADLVGRQDGYVLNADIDYKFSQDVIDALTQGVPLTLNVIVELHHRREFLWDHRVSHTRLRYRIRYRALAELFQVVNLMTGVKRNFASLQAAVDALGHVRGVFFPKAGEVEEGEKYDLSMKAQLDLEALPLPLRPVAYLTQQWHLSSSWYRWPLQK